LLFIVAGFWPQTANLSLFALNINSRPDDNGQLVKSKGQTWMLSLRLTRRCLANHLGVSGICPTDVCLVFQGDFIMGHFGLISKLKLFGA
jgi:hypothetical protein